MRALGRHRFQGLRNDFFNLPIADLARCADPRLIQQAVQPQLSKPFPPFADGCPRDVQLPRDLEVAHPLPTTEHDPGAHRHGLRRLWSTRDHSQFVALLFRHFQRFLGTPGTHTQVCSLIWTYSTYFSLSTLRTKDASLQTMGVWIIEMGELSGMHKAELEHVKAFITRRIERFRPPYGKRLVTSPRQCVFSASTNDDEYLIDPTGGPPFWPLPSR